MQNKYHIIASELKDPIWHSLEWQIGSFSSEATIINYSILSDYDHLKKTKKHLWLLRVMSFYVIWYFCNQNHKTAIQVYFLCINVYSFIII